MVARKSVVDDPLQMLGLLRKVGWFHYSSEFIDHESILRELGQLGNRLGRRVPRRAGSLEEFVEPRPPHEARPRSLSSRYSLGTLPFHAELSHSFIPCRYSLLGRIESGSQTAATVL